MLSESCSYGHAPKLESLRPRHHFQLFGSATSGGHHPRTIVRDLAPKLGDPRTIGKWVDSGSEGRRAGELAGSEPGETGGAQRPRAHRRSPE
jgi:hypothetical protein